VNALRLTHATVDALVGEDYFDQVARHYVLEQPPRHASLDGYGETFARFLASLPSAQGLPYLSDVARLDWAIDRALRRSLTTRAFVLSAQAVIRLPASLAVMALSYPAHTIRESLDNVASLRAIDLKPSDRYVVSWRQHDTAAVLSIRPPAARFLSALLDGAAPDAAAARAGGEPVFPIIQADIFAAPFCAATPLEEVP
jgi:hypothetical protein